MMTIFLFFWYLIIIIYACKVAEYFCMDGFAESSTVLIET